MVPTWLEQLSVAALWIAGACAILIALDIAFFHRQKMWIMNIVWPVTALYFGPLAVWFYWSNARHQAKKQTKDGKQKPFWKKAAVGTTHCGAGCTVGDFAGEWLVFLTGFTIAGSVLWANYAVDFVFAYIVGIVFQYFSIAPMRGVSGWEGIIAAVKADTISLIAFEVGMFAFMGWSSAHFRPRLEPTQPTYWFMMQIAMIVGFVTSYPANWWLIRKKLKEAM